MKRTISKRYRCPHSCVWKGNSAISLSNNLRGCKNRRRIGSVTLPIKGERRLSNLALGDAIETLPTTECNKRKEQGTPTLNLSSPENMCRSRLLPQEMMYQLPFIPPYRSEEWKTRKRWNVRGGMYCRLCQL